MDFSYRKIKRYKKIIEVMFKYGFGFLIKKKESLKDNKITVTENKNNSLSIGQRLRFAFEELGPTFVKIGQILSTRQDIFNDDIIQELSKLRDEVKPFDTNEAKKIIEKELDVNIEAVFNDFSEKSISSASIGQVYSAKLKNAEEIVIKVQRPNIRPMIQIDLEIIKKIAIKYKEKHMDLKIDLKGIIEELESQLLRELNYKYEATNGRKMASIFKGSNSVKIPYIYEKYSTEKVLTMEKINGISLSDLNDSKKLKKRQKELNLKDEEIEKMTSTKAKKNIAQIGIKSFFKQVILNGFFHADPHPGNIFVLNENKIAYIDFGMVGIIDKKNLRYIKKIVTSVTEQNADKIVDVIIEMNALNKDYDNDKIRRDILYLIHYYYDLSFENIKVAEILNEIFNFMRTYKINMPSDLTLLSKTVITLEGTALMLDSTISVQYILKIYLYYYRKESLKFYKNTGKILSEADDYYYKLIELPGQLSNIIKNIESNNVGVDLKLKELNIHKVEKSVVKITTLLSLSIILAACIIGTSQIISSPYVLKNEIITLFGIFGFAVSFIIGLTVVVIIIKNQLKNK